MFQEKLIKGDGVAVILAVLVGSRVFAIAVETSATSPQVITNIPVATRATWPRLENFQGAANTNGLSCRLEINYNINGSVRTPPVCGVWVENKSATVFLKCWTACPTNYFSIELFDSTGKRVEKTIAGKQYGAMANEKQLTELRKELYSAKNSGLGPRTITAQIPSNQRWKFTSFYIAPLYELKQPGEYSLRVKMRLIQAVGTEQFKSTWLPEVIAKVQIRAEDILNGDMSLSPTNYPLK